MNCNIVPLGKINVKDEIPFLSRNFFIDDKKSKGLKYLLMEFLNWECEDIHDIDH